MSRHEKGRGAVSNRAGRFARQTSEQAAYDWADELDALPKLATMVRAEAAKSIISRNTSPDVPFEQSINPYRGCEHGCVYCFARPTHSYLDLSPGLDFETRLYYKQNAAELVETELRKPGYICKPITIGANTDPYQPIEREHRITRQLLETMLEYRHPVSLITKGSLIERDLDLLAELARLDLASVHVSVTSLDQDLKRKLEPRAASASARLRTIERLAASGVPVSALIAPVIPALTDHELESIVERVAAAGAGSAGYVLLRLPHEVAGLFVEWLESHYPDRARHIMSLVRQSRGGKNYDSAWGQRMRGSGHFADLIETRFRLACRRNGLARRSEGALRTDQFRLPERTGDQLALNL
ncbi:MAG TPA: PA0069 family radical SAM protein [Wenzhouxiangellaceae bacterium]|nr:PA0069 family radical SAM protein [Wenzhouxiangellaceae bacterium]